MGFLLWFLMGPILIGSFLNLFVGVAVYSSAESFVLDWLRKFDCVENAIAWLQLFSAVLAVGSVLFAVIAHFFRNYICSILYGCNAIISGFVAVLYYFVVQQP